MKQRLSFRKSLVTTLKKKFKINKIQKIKKLWKGRLTNSKQ